MYTIASLSEQSWVSDPRSILGYVMTAYMLSDAAQTNVFKGNVKSLSETYFKYINEPIDMASAMSSELSSLLSHYFAHADVKAEAKEISGKSYAISLQVSVITKEGERLDLSKIMEIDSQSLRKIINISNYGDAATVLSSYS